MTPRERQLATIRHAATDRVSTDTLCIEDLPGVAHHLGLPEDEVFDALGIDGRRVAAPLLTPPAALSGMPLNEWGTPETGNYGTSHPAPLASASSAKEVEQYAWPDPAGYDFDAAAAKARELGARYAVRGPYWHPIFCRVCDLLGMERAMVAMLTEEALFESLLENVSTRVFAYCEQLMDACGPDLPILCLGDDFATQRGLMIAPDLWRRYLKPCFARIFEGAKRRGKFVWFHSCGDITAILPDLIDIGMDVWETVQLHALPISPRELKRQYGADLTFFGAVNTQRLPFRSPLEVREEVRRCIDVLGAGGGYICGPDHHIKPDVPPANTVALYQAATGFLSDQ